MSPIAVGLDLILIALLLAALAYGARLNKRLKALRDTQAGFAQAALSLDAAIARAETGLADLRGLAAGSDGALAERIEEARAATKRLEVALARTKAPAVAVETQEPAEPLDLAAKIPPAAAVREDRVLHFQDILRQRAPLPVAADSAPPPARSRARVDDDLFAEPAFADRVARRAGGRA